MANDLHPAEGAEEALNPKTTSHHLLPPPTMFSYLISVFFGILINSPAPSPDPEGCCAHLPWYASRCEVQDL